MERLVVDNAGYDPVFSRLSEVDKPDTFDLAAQRFHGKTRWWRWRHGHHLTEYPGYIVAGAAPLVYRDGRVDWPDNDPPLLITFGQIREVSESIGMKEVSE